MTASITRETEVDAVFPKLIAGKLAAVGCATVGGILDRTREQMIAFEGIGHATAVSISLRLRSIGFEWPKENGEYPTRRARSKSRKEEPHKKKKRKKAPTSRRRREEAKRHVRRLERAIKSAAVLVEKLESRMSVLLRMLNAGDDSEIAAGESRFHTPISDLGLSPRPTNCFQNAGIVLLGELVVLTEVDLLRLPNFGRKSLREVKEALADGGLHLGMRVPGFNAPYKGTSPGRVEIKSGEDYRRALVLVLPHLRVREGQVLISRFGLDGRAPKTLQEIGDDLGVTRERAHQLEKSAGRRLRSLQISDPLEGRQRQQWRETFWKGDTKLSLR
jgi:hypothetical protein